MNPNNPSPWPDPLAGDTRYHYLYGRHWLYGGSRTGTSYPPMTAAYAGPFFSTGTPITQVDEGPQTVEQLVTQGYFAAPASDPETAFLHDRRHTAWLGLDDIVAQIRQRWKLYEQNMLEIEWGKCYAFNELARQSWPASADQYYTYPKRMQELHGEQRQERLAAWKDVSRLRQLLPETAQQYLSAFRKTEILKDRDGDDL